MAPPDGDAPVVLVTGARKGIGRHLAEHYAARGWRVVGCSRGAAEPVAGDYVHHQADVSDEAAVRRLFGEVRRSHGRLDLLVNNAAVNPAISPAMLVPAAAVQRAFATNVLGVIACCTEGAKLMMRGRYGRIVNLGSMAVRHEVRGESVYTATKAAVVAFTRVFAKEVHGYGITCNVVAPAAVPTDLMDAVDSAALQEVLSRNAIPSVGTMEDVSAVVDWLASPQSAAVTGQVIYLGGA